MKKIERNAGIALFLAALYIVPVCFATGADREFSENENRYLEQRPELSAEAVVSGEYMKAAEKYISDQFPARDRGNFQKTKTVIWNRGRSCPQRRWYPGNI